MYTDPVVIAGMIAIGATIAVVAGVFIFIWMDSHNHPDDSTPDKR